MRAIGIAGWSGAGKTRLIARLIPELARRGLSVSTIKHSHHDVEMDAPGKDSFVHREAGAREALLASPRRFALVREHGEGQEPSLAELLCMMSPVELVLIEGFKRERHRKIEVVGAGNDGSLWPGDPHVVAIVGDAQPAPDDLPRVDADDIAAVAELVLFHAEDLPALVDRLKAAR